MEERATDEKIVEMLIEWEKSRKEREEQLQLSRAIFELECG